MSTNWWLDIRRTNPTFTIIHIHPPFLMRFDHRHLVARSFAGPSDTGRRGLHDGRRAEGSTVGRGGSTT